MTRRRGPETLTSEQTKLAALFADTDLSVPELALRVRVSEDGVRLQLREICRRLGLYRSREALRAYMLTVELAPGGDQ